MIPSQYFRRKTMKFRARMIATMAIVTLLAPACLFAAEDSTNSPAANAAADSRIPHEAADKAELAATLASAQPATHALSSGRWDSAYPKVELFLGYTYLRGVPTMSPGNRMDWLNGGTASIAYNFNRYLGLVADVGGFRASELQLFGAGASPARVSDASGNAFTYMAGPRLSLRKYDRLTPFAQVQFGGIHASEVTLSNCAGSSCTPLPTENAFALTAGGGIDFKVNHHIAIRIVQAEYMMTRFGDLHTGIRDTQNDMRLSSGLVFGFGGTPPPPVTYTCSVAPTSGYPGDPVTVTGTALNLNPKKTARYTWTSTGGTISGTSSAANIDTKTMAPGTYTVTGHVTEGARPAQSADCTGQFTINAFQPPTISCSANPSSVNPGDSSTIAASAMSPQNRPITYSYSSTAGSISGTSSSATLATAGASPGPITVTCNVVDDKGNTASSTTSVNVIAPPPPQAPPAPMTSSLCSVSFERDAERPTRVDNEAKACLDDVSLALQRSSDAKIAMVGSTDSKELATKRNRKKPNFAAERAVNTKEYLVTDKGIDPSRIAVYTGSDDARTVTLTLIPVGATLSTANDTPVDESAVKAVPRTARRHHHK
jgi:opacity protein-like surface antigen